MPLRILKDCLYDFIRVTPLCQQFLDQPEVQRLRDILQLGVVRYVYKDATHSRLAHSTGVMYLAGRVVDVVREHGAAVDDREKELVELAGLLHDVGHVALSHMMDRGGEPHEARSCALVRRMNDRLRLLTDAEVELVGCMIRGEVPDGHPRPFLFQIVSNELCGIDVDRMDYLFRDSRACGQPAFQCGYIVMHARVEPATRTLAFSHKASAEIERMFRARNDMIRIVYRHRAVVAVERLVLALTDEVGFGLDRPPHGGDSAEPFAWVQMTDPELICAIKRSPRYHLLETRQWERCEDASAEVSSKVIEGQELERQLAAVPLVHD